MTEKEILTEQEKNGNVSFYLIKIGMFYHAYGNGAFALARLMDYRVKEKARRKGQTILTCGFPVNSIGKVTERMREKHIAIEKLSDNDGLFLFSGADGTPNPTLVDTAIVEPALSAHEADKELQRLKEQILSFNLARATPVEAMLFVDKLQKSLL